MLFHAPWQFSYISLNWRGKPLTSYEVVVNLIGSTTTANGLKVKSELDKNIYEKGIKVPDEDFKKINIIKDQFHGHGQMDMAFVQALIQFQV